MIEAMAKGLPVIGSGYGSLPEIIGTHGGIVCKNYDEFESTLSLTKNQFNAFRVREYFEKNFTSSIMAINYIKYYELILHGNSFNSQNPKTLSPNHPEQLLEF